MSTSRDRCYDRINNDLASIRNAGLWKNERIIVGPQGRRVDVAASPGYESAATPLVPLLNLCANNYLGMSNHADVVRAAQLGIGSSGYGLSSVRFICGTQDIHRRLEQELAAFFGKEDAILFSSCFDANTGLLEQIVKPSDVIVSDELIHASLIDGIRLVKGAAKLRYRNNNMADLRDKMQEAAKKTSSAPSSSSSSSSSTTKGSGGTIFIVLDGVFSMDGVVADCAAVCKIADEFGAIVIVDDSHASGVLGPTGRGSAELASCLDRVDILTTTLGKALGGGAGGLVAARRPVIDLLRQRARPYLFSNTLPPATVHASLRVLEILRSEEGARLRKQLMDNAAYFKHKMALSGFRLGGGASTHPIVPVLCEGYATQLAQALYKRGIFAVAFSFPVVPRGQARVRVQLSALHTPCDLDRAHRAFVSAALEVGLLTKPASESKKPKAKL